MAFRECTTSNRVAEAGVARWGSLQDGQLGGFDSAERYCSGEPGWVDRDGCHCSKGAPATFLIRGEWLEPPGRSWRRDLPCFWGWAKERVRGRSFLATGVGRAR